MIVTDDLINKLIGECFSTEQEINDINKMLEDEEISKNVLMTEKFREYVLICEARLTSLHGQIGFLILEDCRRNGA